MGQEVTTVPTYRRTDTTDTPCECHKRGAHYHQHRIDRNVTAEACMDLDEVWVRTSRACGVVVWFPLSLYADVNCSWEDLIYHIQRRTENQCESYYDRERG